MHEVVNDCLVKLISYYEMYYSANYGDWGILEEPQFPLDILAIAVFLEMPEHQSIMNIEDIKKFLLDNYVNYSDAMQKKICIEAYCRRDDCICRNGFYIWSVFHYTYEMENDEEKKRREFLCISIILPYIYKLNKYKHVKKRDLNKIMIEYEIVQYIRELNGLDLFNEKKTEEYFQKIIHGITGLDDMLPKKDEADTVVEEASYGAKLMILVYAGGKYYDERLWGK